MRGIRKANWFMLDGDLCPERLLVRLAELSSGHYNLSPVGELALHLGGGFNVR
jgi:hypothetical protein